MNLGDADRAEIRDPLKASRGKSVPLRYRR
jgi:hypothetical protein